MEVKDADILAELLSESRDTILDSFNTKEAIDTESGPSHQFSITIYSVPVIVRKFNSAAYKPRAFSLGLYNVQFNRQNYDVKYKHVMKFINRNYRKFVTSNLIERVQRDEVRVYTCYAKPDAKRDDCLKLLVPNAIFIIEYLINQIETEVNKSSFTLAKIHKNHDLLLLENQIPYFFLQFIFNHFYPSSSPLILTDGKSPTFNDLVMSFFHKYNVNGMVNLDFTSVMHFTDLIRKFHEPKRPTSDHSRYPDSEFTASATQLHASGVVFKKVSGICLLDVNFNKNILELSCFELNEDQESLYRNLMALELCHYPDDTFIIDYFVFMDTLINTADDISLLVEAGVLVNRIGNYHNAANTFNKFCAGITNYDVRKSYLVPVYAKLDAYYKKPEHTWKTTFKRDYFGTPLKKVTTVTAVFLVVLTFISTVCSVISVVLTFVFS